jgi:hypothetical protein
MKQQAPYRTGLTERRACPTLAAWIKPAYTRQR